MKVVIINPPNFTRYKEDFFYCPSPALSQLAGYISSKGHEVHVEDLNTIIDYIAFRRNRYREMMHTLDNPEKLGMHLSGSQKDTEYQKAARSLYDFMGIGNQELICFSIMTDEQMAIALMLAMESKKHCNPKVLFGGSYITKYTDFGKMPHNLKEAVESPFVDGLIWGDGELPLEEYIRFMEGRIEAKDVPGLIYKASGSIMINRSKCFDINREIKLPKKMPYRQYLGRHPSAPYILRITKGCQYALCRFCSLQRYHPRFQIRDLHNIEKEIIDIHEIGIKTVFLGDNEIPYDNQYITELSRMFKRHGITWVCQIRVGKLDDNTANILKEGGCVEILSGAESFCDTTLRLMRKPHKVENIINDLKTARKYDIRMHIPLLIGFPGESSIEVTIQALLRNRDILIGNTININRFILEYGSPIYQSKEDYGISDVRLERGRFGFPNGLSYSLPGLDYQAIKASHDRIIEEYVSVCRKLNLKIYDDERY